MIKINLLPVREWKQKERARQQVSIFFLTLIFLLVAGIAASILLQGKLIILRNEAKKLQQQKARLAYVNKAILEAEEKSKSIEEKFKTIENLQLGRTKAIEVIDEVASTIPIDRLWITSLSLKGNNLNIKGVAMDNHTVALFMRRLGALKLFQIVNLTNIQRQQQSKSRHPVEKVQEELMNFDLDIVISSTEQKTQPQKTGQKG